ncbi:hypothetical protein ATO6_07625 [Oceanicola sp. 22II-s10i]|uniref:S1C family serine protease n=1 Tax=Oceanicola sp. 22II-s10i TaxID=1317116 RepID=UPI000B52638A|nr:trypsin-like peptidase domain-containing protein [Oceanicola sp. 22II-s10i]OWU86637.1 hypothetical protein ATO6_07625 [Oceanicola sp. 22II-s10i]
MTDRPIRYTPHRAARRPFLLFVPLMSALVVLVASVTGSRADVADTALAATLVVESDDMDAAFLGSATLWGDGTVAVTSAHVVKDRIRVALRNRDGLRVSASVTARDKVRDLALIALPGGDFGAGLPPATDRPPLGAPVLAFGAPLETEFSMTGGMVSAPDRQTDPAIPVALIQHDAAINPGSSGGPLVDAAGHVVGINTRIADGSRLFAGIAYATPAATVVRFVAGDLPAVVRLGLTVRPVTPRIAQALGLKNGRAILVDDVEHGSLAWRSGVEAGNVLTALDAHPLARPADLAWALETIAGDEAQLTIIRNGAEMQLLLDLTPDTPAIQGTSAPAAGMIGRVTAYTWDSLGVWFADGGTTVKDISKSSPAYRAGLAEGDVIRAVNGAPATPETLAAQQIDGALVIRVDRAGRSLHVIVDPWTNVLPNVPIGGANALDPAVSVF